ncbi:hypothetical protein BJF83_05525 [Nocardiopsis sp. CNR-923]|uniref:SCO6745 family protein n=1 Tax=Nocardiopsis sp. CNR-923 TaxID=1904965 RepID=UPI00096250A4|nr:hypothetical protein [Nocardiopsis sp. CNR-923]OLT24958.1 hypothetical protein BJF83_05525 [Nocardiopsis sp. CNR-923]
MNHHDTAGGSVGAGQARRAWQALEPYHAMIYFSPEAMAAYEELGVKDWAAYFGPRAAAMGPVSAEVVVATFYNFNPVAVRAAVLGLWDSAPPERLLAARHTAVDATVRRVLGEAVNSPETARAAELARRAAEAVAEDVSGRPLYAAHAALPWPEEPHMVLWHAQTRLREYRGDGHVAALVTEGLSGLEALVTHALTGTAPPAKVLRATRAWSDQEWDGAVDRLRERGWLTGASDPELTPEGRRHRERIEETTDRLALAPYAALGADGCAELADLAAPLSGPLAEALMPWRRSKRP